MERAAEIRDLAGEVRNPETRRVLLEIAADYQRLAEQSVLEVITRYLDPRSDI
jgi:hypothetical protein